MRRHNDNPHRTPLVALASALVLFSAGASSAAERPGTWSFSGKTGIGTSYEDPSSDRAGQRRPSKVWFSLAQGVVTETMFGLIHEAQLKRLQVGVLVDGRLETELADADSVVSYLHQDAAGRPASLAYRIVSRARSGAWETEKHVFTDPDGDVLFVRVTVRATDGKVRPFLLLDPQMAGTSGGDTAQADSGVLQASEGRTHLAVRASEAFVRSGAGQASGGLPTGLTGEAGGARAAKGDVELWAELPSVDRGATRSVDVALGFGHTAAQASATAKASLARGYAEVLAAYNGEGARIGWEDYLASLPQLPRLAEQSTDGGRLLQVSAMVLKAQEDKTYPGALIASLSTPWGDTVNAATLQTGYKAVWPRDLYHVASALLAMGDTRTAMAALEYLRTIQVGPKTPGARGAGGWFLQKTHVDGTPEWVAVQLDQTAMPVMLAWKLRQAGVLTDARLAELYPAMLKPAADFLIDGGSVSLDWNKAAITPPRTQQERWEEQGGYSPSTTAAVVAGLIAAADLADSAGDPSGARRYRVAADDLSARIERLMFTTTGRAGSPDGRGRYFLRISPNTDPNDREPLEARNGQQALAEDLYLDAGFLELVRYGVRRADDPHILDSLPELDLQEVDEALKVKYDFRFPGEAGAVSGWRRYGGDGYGEDVETGANYGDGKLEGGMGAGQRGRVWPLLTGERGHYDLARDLLKPGGVTDADVAGLRATYVHALELFANEGLMIPEQVWDGVGRNPGGYVVGEGTNSATPLAWSHAEYVRLLRSLADRRVWDSYPNVAARYAKP